jgi:hypothetical protein
MSVVTTFLRPPTRRLPFRLSDEQAARDLAPAYINTFASLPEFREPLELQRGAPINLVALRAAMRVEFAETPYEVLPDSAPRWLRRSLGSAFVVRLTEAGVPAVAVSVARHATELFVVDGRVRFPPDAGGEFQAFGMRADPGYSSPIGPERATEVAARLTGAKITELPILLRPLSRFAMTFARWKLVLDREITVVERATGIERRTQVLYVGLQPIAGVPGGNPAALFIASAEQPGEDTLQAGATYTIGIRPGIPVYFEEISAVP